MKSGLYIKLVLLTLLFSSLSSYSQAQLAIDRIIVDFTANSPPREDVRLTNSSSTDTLYIQVDVLEVSSPGTDKEQRVVVDDPAKIGLIASPNKLIIPPNSSQLVRLVSLLPPEDSDRIFRVDFTPVVGEQDIEQSSVQIMVAYQALVIVRPARAVVDIQGERDGNTLTLRNNGNTNAYLESGTHCMADSSDECQPLPANRLYAGNTMEIELPGDGEVSFSINTGDRIITRVF